MRSSVALSVCSDAPSARTIGAQKISAASAGRLHRHKNLRLFMASSSKKTLGHKKHRFAGQSRKLIPCEFMGQYKIPDFCKLIVAEIMKQRAAWNGPLRIGCNSPRPDLTECPASRELP